MNYLKRLMNQGFLVEQNVIPSLERLDEASFQRILENLQKEKAFMLSANVLNRFLQDKKVEIIKTFETVKKLSVKDYVALLNERYEKLQQILLKKLDQTNLVSINKATNGAATLIGLVKKIEEKNNDDLITIEDQTGEMDTFVPKKFSEKIKQDDVVAISGIIKNKTLYADNIVYPDIPLRQVNYSKDDIIVSFSEKDKKADFVITNNKIIDNLKNEIHEISNPSIIRIDNVTILVAHSFDPLEILRRRFIHHNYSDFIIDPVPDILFTDKSINTNYKGVSIVSEIKLNLKNREILS